MRPSQDRDDLGRMPSLFNASPPMDNVAAALCDLETGGGRNVLLLVVRARGHAALHIDPGTDQLAVQLHVDHACNRARTPGGGGTAGNHVHAADQDRGNAGQIVVAGEAPPIQQHQGAAYAEATQVDRRPCRVHAGGMGLRRHRTAELRQVVERGGDIGVWSCRSSGVTFTVGVGALKPGRSMREPDAVTLTLPISTTLSAACSGLASVD